jgi:hypothetical protein
LHTCLMLSAFTVTFLHLLALVMCTSTYVIKTTNCEAPLSIIFLRPPVIFSLFLLNTILSTYSQIPHVNRFSNNA